MAIPKPFQFGIIKVLNVLCLLFCAETYAKAKEASAALWFGILIQLSLAMLEFLQLMFYFKTLVFDFPLYTDKWVQKDKALDDITVGLPADF